MSIQATPSFSFRSTDTTVSVHPDRAQVAGRIDKDQNGELSDQELLDHIHATESCHHAGEDDHDDQALLREFKLHLSKTRNPDAPHYHSYEEVAKELDDLQRTYPFLAQRVSLGKTHEGRDIWALKISEDVRSADTASRPGVVITGCHHAREWMSMEVPLHVAHELLDNYATDENARKRVKEGEIWIVPLVNPDGYEHSRTEDNWWRKNRRPVEHTATGQETSAVGVDLNRNYYDGNPDHLYLYRPDGDTPGSTWDNHGATSDDPDSDTYRGPAPASESETQAMVGLEVGHKNIRGIIDHHSYGNMILYPWGHTTEPCEQVELYKELGGKLNAAMDNSFRVMQSSGLYPSAGESDDAQHVNGIVTYTFEIGRSFQPNASQIGPMCEKVGRGNLKFIDEIIDRAKAGTLPERL